MKILIILVLFSWEVFARSPQKAIKAKKRTEIQDVNSSRRVATQKFSGLKLKGQLKKPDLSYIYKRKGLRADQVVDVPQDFNSEIIESALTF